MNRVLVVPWSIAPTKSGIGSPRFHGGVKVALRQTARLGGLRRQEPADEHLVQTGADQATDDRGDDRNPEVQGPVLVAHRPTVAGEELGNARPEVAGGVDRVARVGAP